MPHLPDARRRGLKAGRALVTIALALVIPRSSPAGIPEPPCWIIPRALPISPDGSLVTRLVIRNTACMPLVGALVEIRFGPAAEELLCWCSPASPGGRVISCRTDAEGAVEFRIAAGGCLPKDDPRIPGPNPIVAEVYADQIKLAECGLVSPDAVDVRGRQILDPGGWEPGARCEAGLSDSVYLTTPLATGSYDFCADINADGMVSLSDATLLTPALAGAAACASNPAVSAPRSRP